MEQKDFNDAMLNYVIHIADNQTKMVEYQTRMAEAMATLGQILERVVQTTDRTEQTTARILAGAAPDKTSH